MLKRIILLSTALSLAVGAQWAGATTFHSPAPAEPFIRSKIAAFDAVFLGTRHRQPELLAFVGRLMAEPVRTGLTHVGLEIASDQQGAVDRFMAGKGRLAEIRIDPNIDCEAYGRLLREIRRSKVRAVALDLPRIHWSGPATRDQWMARRLDETFSENPGARILVVVGNLHALKEIQWLAPNLSPGGIRNYLSAMRPSLKLFSVTQSIGLKPGQCPYNDRFGGRHKSPIAVATAQGSPAPGFLRLAAAAAMDGPEAVDAVIVY